jgi:hypothetical protein
MKKVLFFTSLYCISVVCYAFQDSLYFKQCGKLYVRNTGDEIVLLDTSGKSETLIGQINLPNSANFDTVKVLAAMKKHCSGFKAADSIELMQWLTGQLAVNVENDANTVNKHENSKTISNGLNTIFIIMVAAGAIFILTMTYLLFKRKSKTSSGEDAQYDLYNVLVSSGAFDIKVNSQEQFADRLIKSYTGLKDDFETQRKKLEREIANRKDLEKEIDRLNKSTKEKNVEITALETSLEERDTKNEELIKKGKMFLQKFYHPLIEKVQGNNDLSREQKQLATIIALCQLGMHGVSLARILTDHYTDYDKYNEDLVAGKRVEPIQTIDINSDLGSSDKLAYIIMTILHEKGIKELPDVYIHGFKIG